MTPDIGSPARNVAQDRLTEANRVVEAWEDAEARTREHEALFTSLGDHEAARWWRNRHRRAQDQLQAARGHADAAWATWEAQRQHGGHHGPGKAV